jgi:hypothetical protein
MLFAPSFVLAEKVRENPPDVPEARRGKASFQGMAGPCHIGAGAARTFRQTR